MEQSVFMLYKKKLIEGSSEKSTEHFLNIHNIIIKIVNCFDYSIEFKKYFFLHKSKSFHCILTLEGLYNMIHFK
jgi:hypothetical protein